MTRRVRRRRHQTRDGWSTRTDVQQPALLQVADLREVMGRREVYRWLSRIGDPVHAVAERIWYAVVKES